VAADSSDGTGVPKGPGTSGGVPLAVMVSLLTGSPLVMW
jgi:hypothetical protein